MSTYEVKITWIPKSTRVIWKRKYLRPWCYEGGARILNTIIYKSNAIGYETWWHNGVGPSNTSRFNPRKVLTVPTFTDWSSSWKSWGLPHRSRNGRWGIATLVGWSHLAHQDRGSLLRWWITGRWGLLYEVSPKACLQILQETSFIVEKHHLLFETE